MTGDGNGWFMVENLPSGRLILESSASPHFSVTGLQLLEGDHGVVEAVVDWGDFSLSGQVMDREGKPLPEAQLTLVWTRESGGVTSRSARSAVADANGNFLFSRLSVGPHQLRADAPGYRRHEEQHVIGTDPAEVLVVLDKE